MMVERGSLRSRKIFFNAGALWPIVPILPFAVLRAPLFRPSDHYQAFRNHRNVRYWGRGGKEKTSREKRENTDRKVDLGA